MQEQVPLMNKEVQVTYLPQGERREDILTLVRNYIKLTEEQVNTGPKELSKEVEEYLLSYDWYGKERELETAVKKACILSEDQVLKREDFDLGHRQVKSIGRFIEERLKGFMWNIKKLEKFNLYDTVMPEVERALILMVMKETRGNQIRAAKLLGINRNTLRSKIKKLKIKVKS
jgi:DNA-binding NtrC family response regulator